MRTALCVLVYGSVLMACGDDPTLLDAGAISDSGLDAGVDAVSPDAAPDPCADDRALDEGIAFDDASDPERTDCVFRALVPRLAGAKIVCSGENVHGVAESSGMHIALARALVRHANVRIIALESIGASADLVEEFVHTGDRSALERSFADARSSLADVVEREEFAEGLRAIDQEIGAGSLRFAGFDVAVQLTTTTESVRAYLELAGYDPGEWPSCLSNNGVSMHEQSASDCEALFDRLEAEAPTLIAEHGAALHARAIRDVENLRDGFRFLERYVAGDFGGGEAFREPGMLRNILALERSLAPGERMLLVAHNGHCFRGSILGTTSDRGAIFSFGSSLGGASYFVIAQLYGGGEHRTSPIMVAPYPSTAGTLEGQVAALDPSPNFLLANTTSRLDLAEWQPILNITNIWPPRASFDALVFMRDVTPTTPR